MVVDARCGCPNGACPVVAQVVPAKWCTNGGCHGLPKWWLQGGGREWLWFGVVSCRWSPRRRGPRGHPSSAKWSDSACGARWLRVVAQVIVVPRGRPMVVVPSGSVWSPKWLRASKGRVPKCFRLGSTDEQVANLGVHNLLDDALPGFGRCHPT